MYLSQNVMRGIQLIKKLANKLKQGLQPDKFFL